MLCAMYLSNNKLNLTIQFTYMQKSCMNGNNLIPNLVSDMHVCLLHGIETTHTKKNKKKSNKKRQTKTGTGLLNINIHIFRNLENPKII